MVEAYIRWTTVSPSLGIEHPYLFTTGSIECHHTAEGSAGIQNITHFNRR